MWIQIMRIRTITTGLTLQQPEEHYKLKKAASFNQEAKRFFAHKSYEVQTVRVATNSWEDYLGNAPNSKIFDFVKFTEQFCQELDIQFLNIGYAHSPERIAIIPEIIKTTSRISCSSKLGDSNKGMLPENIKASADSIKRISEETEKGEGNFRYCAWANCEPGIPFFPAGYHEGEPSFGIGLECGDLVMKAFSRSNNLTEAEQNLESVLYAEFKKVADVAEEISKNRNMSYRGIDLSPAPSLEKEGSLAFAYEKLGVEKFGFQGSLAISALITRVLKSLPLKKCGYSGLFLPVCEDRGLAQRASEQTFHLANLLLYSAVCGCGYDTIPLPGDIAVEKLEAILLDMAMLALTLNKSLSARLFPVPGKRAGEMTEFKSPYLVDSRILGVD
jgi:uncharacterized protein (UPF0210 family)